MLEREIVPRLALELSDLSSKSIHSLDIHRRDLLLQEFQIFQSERQAAPRSGKLVGK
jgi:hypothetical protein